MNDEITKEDLQLNVARNIQVFRLSMGLTQEALGKKLGISYHTVAGYEVGNRMPPYLTLIKMSQIFGKSLESLLGVEMPKSQETTLEEDALLTIFRDSAPLARRFIIESARGISQLNLSEMDNPGSYISRKRGEYSSNR